MGLSRRPKKKGRGLHCGSVHSSPLSLSIRTRMISHIPKASFSPRPRSQSYYCTPPLSLTVPAGLPTGHRLQRTEKQPHESDAQVALAPGPLGPEKVRNSAHTRSVSVSVSSVSDSPLPLEAPAPT